MQASACSRSSRQPEQYSYHTPTTSQPQRAARARNTLHRCLRMNLFLVSILFYCVIIQCVMCTPFLERSSSLPPDAILPPYPPDQHVTESAVAQAGNDALPAVESGIKDLKRRQTQSQFPTPFDGGMGNNFTSSSCPLFFNNFLNDPNFQQCHAISLLLVVRTHKTSPPLGISADTTLSDFSNILPDEPTRRQLEPTP